MTRSNHFDKFLNPNKLIRWSRAITSQLLIDFAVNHVACKPKVSKVSARFKNDVAAYKIRPLEPEETVLAKAINFRDGSHNHARQIFDFYSINSSCGKNSSEDKGKMLEIGGSNTLNSSNKFKEFEYLNLDIEPNKELPTLVGDITTRIDLPDEYFDVIVSHQTFEHIKEPWKAAEEMVRLLKPGGFLYVSTVWSWRYHPVPVDYWRFSPDCLEFLFKDLSKLESNFNLSKRRQDMRGYWPNSADAVPVDEFGGWRENWLVYFAGIKTKISKR